MKLTKEQVDELDVFVQRNDIANDFDDIVSVQEIYNEDVRNLIETLRAAWDEIDSHAPNGRNYTNEQYVSLLLKYEQVKQERDDYAAFLVELSGADQTLTSVDEIARMARDILTRYKR
jgi:hypothetical protein